MFAFHICTNGWHSGEGSCPVGFARFFCVDGVDATHKKCRPSRLVFHLHRPFTMSDDNDFHIEQTDAGASATIPMEAGQIKKGG